MTSRTGALALLCGAAMLQAQQPLDKTTIARWMQELSNWGRWGRDDQMGTINLITSAQRKAAAALVKEGFAVSLSRDADAVKSADNPFPFGYQPVPNAMFGMDIYTMRYHNQSTTHIDSLSHMYVDGRMYNGFSQSEVTPTGAHKLAVTAFKNGIASRGILMDIARLQGVKYLANGAAITPADFDAWEQKAGIRVGAGDIVFIRAGHWVRRKEKGPWDSETGAAGMHPSCARWFRQRGVAMIGSETHGEVMPAPVKDVPFPLHQLLLVAMGMPMLDNCDLDALADAAASRRRWEFFVTVSPLAVPGGTGSPVNPTAIF
jgi:kynurenine formamidase